jgi:hypothetical protein
MHGTLFALTLAAYLFATDPSGVLARLWGRAEAPASTTLEKEGPGLDPDGAKAPVHASEAGPGLDPSGHS